MDNLKLLVAEIIAGIVFVLILYGMYTGAVGSLFAISETAGAWLAIFLVLLVIIDVFLIVYTLNAWEHE